MGKLKHLAGFIREYVPEEVCAVVYFDPEDALGILRLLIV
jgi:hypothetical protein